MANEKLNDFISSAKKATKKAANTTLELADIAALKVKLQAHNVKLSEKFEELGRLSYAKLADDADNAEKIAACVEEIDKIKNSIEDVNAEIKVKKDARKKKKCAETFLNPLCLSRFSAQLKIFFKNIYTISLVAAAHVGSIAFVFKALVEMQFSCAVPEVKDCIGVLCSDSFPIVVDVFLLL